MELLALRSGWMFEVASNWGWNECLSRDIALQWLCQSSRPLVCSWKMVPSCPYAQYLRRRKPMCTCCGIRWHRDMYSRKGTLSLRAFSIFGVWRVPKNEFASLVFEELMKRFESPWLKPVQTCLFCQTCLVRTTAYWFVDVWSLYYNLWQSIKNEITQEDLDTVYLMMHLS